MSITLFLAASRNGVIGSNNDIPWRLSADLKRFKQLTVGRFVVMGRKTWESLPKKPLPDRQNIVLTNKVGYSAPGAIVFHSLNSIIKHKETTDIVIIGGEEIYKQFLPFADKVELTIVDADIQGDTYFTNFTKPSWNTGWKLEHSEEFPSDDKNQYPYKFTTWTRIREGKT